MLGNGIFTQEDVQWRSSRDTIRPFMCPRLTDCTPHVEALIGRLKSIALCRVDLQEHFRQLTLDATMETILGLPVDNFTGKTGLSFSKAFAMASRVTGTRIRLGNLYFLYHPRGFSKACQVIKEHIDQVIETALSNSNEANIKPENRSLIEEFHERLPTARIRDQVLNILLAGQDTTAATLSYAFLLLLRHPDELKKLQNEISDIVGGKLEITPNDIQRMSLLQNVLRES